MAGLEMQQQTSNEVSHAEWSAQDRLRQELRELEAQQRAEQAAEGMEQRTRQVIEESVVERVRRATVSSTELKGETGVRNRKRRKGGVLQRIPYSFDVLCLCAATIGAAFVIGPLTHPSSISGPHKLLTPTSGAVGMNPGNVFGMDECLDARGNDWKGSSIRVLSSTPGEGGLVNINTQWKYIKDGQPYGYEECVGEWNRATGEVHLRGVNVQQIAYDGVQLIPGEYTFTLGPDGTIENGVMQGLDGTPAIPCTFRGRMR